MKIGVITSTYPRFKGDSASPFVRSLSEGIASLGHRVWVLAPYDPLVREDYDASGLVRVKRFRYFWGRRWNVMGYAKALVGDQRLKRSAFWLSPFYFTASALALFRLHARERLDLLHAHWVIPNGVPAALAASLLHLPLIITLHGSDIYLSEKNPLLGFLSKLALRRAAQVSACSPDLEARARKLGARDSALHVIPWGADPDVFAPVDASHLRSSLGLDPKERVVLGIGRLVPKKGFEYLVQAAPLIIAKEKKVRIVLAGAGSQGDYLKKKVRALGMENTFRFPGAIPWSEVPAYLSLGDIFVAPSITDEQGNVDGLPTVILEAMASGKPVVASRLAGIPAVVRDGENGLLVPEKDVPALAEAILKLIQSPEKGSRMGQAGRRLVEEQFNWKKVAMRFEELYQKAAAPMRK